MTSRNVPFFPGFLPAMRGRFLGFFTVLFGHGLAGCSSAPGVDKFALSLTDFDEPYGLR